MPTEPALFRPEVSEHRRQGLQGEVILNQSVSVSLLVATMVAIAAAAIAWVTLGSYARTETVRGILVTERPSAKVAAPAPGIVAELAVREGTVVRKGDRLTVENRAGSANLSEAAAFMDDDKRVLVFSDAGGTGRSYHADLAARNQRLPYSPAASGAGALLASLYSVQKSRPWNTF